MIAQALQMLNESRDHVYSLGYNPTLDKYVVLSMLRVDTEHHFVLRPFTQGATPEAALIDALKLAAAGHTAEHAIY